LTRGAFQGDTERPRWVECAREVNFPEDNGFEGGREREIKAGHEYMHGTKKRIVGMCKDDKNRNSRGV